MAPTASESLIEKAAATKTRGVEPESELFALIAVAKASALETRKAVEA